MGKNTILLKSIVFLALCAGVAYTLFLTPVGRYFLTPEGRRILVDRLDMFVKASGTFGPAAFILVYAAGALVFPATPFSVAGAIIFGKYVGAICNLIGAVACASASFFLGRYFLRGLAEGFLARGKLATLDEKAGEHGFSVIFYLRIFWFPFIVLNYAAGATRIRFSDYFLGTLLGIAPAIAIVSFFFGNLKEIAASFRGPSDLLQSDILIPAALLLLSFFLPSVHKRIRKARGDASPPGSGA